jgi:hypothetical protein
VWLRFAHAMLSMLPDAWCQLVPEDLTRPIETMSPTGSASH